ncbi:enolase-like domain-containing protein [Flindersiella endophytica]
MPIVEVACQVVRAPLHTPFVTALRRTEHVESLLVRLTDDDGHTGYGEAPQVWRVTGESLAGAQACCEGPLRDVVLTRDPEDLNALLHELNDAVVGNQSAKAAG